MKKYSYILLLTAFTSTISFGQNLFYPNSDSTWSFRAVRGVNIEDAELNGRGDAMDGFFDVRVAGSGYNPVGMDTSGMFFTAPAQAYTGFEVSKQYWFHPAKPLVRTLIRVHNTILDTVSLTLDVDNNYGSDSQTQVYRTSNNSMTIDGNTRWAVTHDSDTVNGDPILTYVQRGPGTIDCDLFLGSNNGAPLVNGYLELGYSFQVPPGEDRYVLLFSEMNDTPSSAASDAAVYNTKEALVNSGYLTGIPQSAWGFIVNWNLGDVLQVSESVNNSFKAYPNPTTGAFTVELGTTQPATLNLRSLTGQLLETQVLEQTSSANFTIEQPQGIYLLEVRTADGQASVVKIVKE